MSNTPYFTKEQTIGCCFLTFMLMLLLVGVVFEVRLKPLKDFEPVCTELKLRMPTYEECGRELDEINSNMYPEIWGETTTRVAVDICNATQPKTCIAEPEIKASIEGAVSLPPVCRCAIKDSHPYSEGVMHITWSPSRQEVLDYILERCLATPIEDGCAKKILVWEPEQ